MNSVIPGLTRNPVQANNVARFEHHWIPASAGMTFIQLARRVDSLI